MSLFRSLRALRDHERGIQADPAWILRTRERLMMQVKNSMPTPEVVAINRRFADRTWGRFLSLAKGPVAAVMAVIAVIFGGSFVSVRAAERSLPGDALYSLKLVTEQAQLALESSKTGKVKLKVEFAKRRIGELQTIMSGTDEDKGALAGQVADMLKQDLHTIKEQLANVSNDSPDQARELAETAKAVDSGVSDVAKTLNETKNDDELSADTKQKVSDAEAQAVDVGMSALVTLIQATKSDSAKDVISQSDINASLAQHVVIVRQTVNDVLNAASGSTSTNALLSQSTSSTMIKLVAATATATSTSGVLAHDAATALAEAETLMQESKTAEAADKIQEANTKSMLAQTAVAADIASASTTAAMNASAAAANSSLTQTTTTNSNATTTLK
ncbi:MAG: DUF5667 domain-containing protein [Patescibacteria group bacterium]